MEPVASHAVASHVVASHAVASHAVTNLISETLIALYGAALAVAFVVMRLAQRLGWTFQTFAALVLVLAGLAALLIVLRAAREKAAHDAPPRRTARVDWRAVAGLLLLGLYSSYLAVAIYRPDTDDFFYLPNSVYYTQHPDAVMSHEVRWVLGLDPETPIASPGWGVSGAFEYFSAALAAQLGLALLDVYYFVMPAVGALLLPCAYFLLLTTLLPAVETRHALLAILAIVVMVSVLNETHRTYGNFAHARFFQGKAVLMTLLVPVYSGFGLRFLQTPTVFRGLSLWLLALAALALSATSIFLIPSLAGLLWLAKVLSRLWGNPGQTTRLLRQWAGRSAVYFASLLPIMLYAVFILRHSTLNQGPINEGWPDDFWGHLRFFTDGAQVRTLLAWGGALGLGMGITRGRLRVFLGAWVGLAVLLFLNPLAGSWLIDNVTTANAYWRLFYILPFPLLVGVIMARVLQRARQSFIQRSLARLSVLAVILLAGMVALGVFYPLMLPPQHKLPPSVIDAALAARLPDGITLAPEPVSLLLPLYHAGLRQVSAQAYGVRAWLPEAVAAPRIAAAETLAGEADAWPAVAAMLTTGVVDNIVLRQEVYATAEAQALFRQPDGAYRELFRAGGYVFLTRHDSGGPP